ncbi:hypothetical protein L873DRAFT_1786053 [Choiromyces venosus 120613-1]|uniref:Uncharacterized protein n=1 Tax=Choiromyces venosus 120613-1 TaxID=1336337 RepID=A0A3N4K3G9_9PEZI|nr:hypothetical protein L873DRAFT_1786053 [Choiromyces venosus 120613-1]
MLGFNYPSHLTFRKKTTCAPIRTEPFKLEEKPTPRQASYFLGDAERWHEQPSLYHTAELGTNRAEYAIRAITEDITYRFHKSLQRDDAHVCVIALNSGNSLTHKPADDPMFSAHRAPPWNIPTVWEGDIFLPDYPVTFTGYIDQFEFCNVMSKNCTGLLSAGSFIPDPEGWGLKWQTSAGVEVAVNFDSVRGPSDPVGAKMALILSHWFSLATIDKIILNRGSSAIENRMASPGLRFFSVKEPWKLEVETWFGVSLAKLQMSPLELVLGMPWEDGKMEGLQQVLPREWIRDLCDMVKLRSPGHTSLNVSGLVFIFVLCVTIVLASMAAELFGVLSPTLHRALHSALPADFHGRKSGVDWKGSGSRASRIDYIPVAKGELQTPRVELALRNGQRRAEIYYGAKSAADSEPANIDDDFAYMLVVGWRAWHGGIMYYTKRIWELISKGFTKVLVHLLNVINWAAGRIQGLRRPAIQLGQNNQLGNISNPNSVVPILAPTPLLVAAPTSPAVIAPTPSAPPTPAVPSSPASLPVSSPTLASTTIPVPAPTSPSSPAPAPVVSLAPPPSAASPAPAPAPPSVIISPPTPSPAAPASTPALQAPVISTPPPSATPTNSAAIHTTASSSWPPPAPPIQSQPEINITPTTSISNCTGSSKSG